MQAIQTRYYGPTNFKGSRIRAKCAARTIWVSLGEIDGNTDPHRYAAQKLRKLLGWDTGHYPDMYGGTFDSDGYWVFADGSARI